MHSFYIGSLLIQLAKNVTMFLDPQVDPQGHVFVHGEANRGLLDT